MSVEESPIVVSAQNYGLDHTSIPAEVLMLITRLKQAGFQAYAVGGCVRDLILGRTPKDFDVVSSARPTQIKSLFSRSRIIGRRFKLVHVVSKSGLITEISTLRKDDQSCASAQQNVYGDDVYLDAQRRDFRINALYYDPDANEIHDYVGGLFDLENYTLDTIGDPQEVLRQDPARILRGLFFLSRLPLSPSFRLAEQIRLCAPYLEQIPARRKYYELDKVLHSGVSLSCFEEIYDYKVWDHLFSQYQSLMLYDRNDNVGLIWRLTLSLIDERVRAKRKVRNALAWASLLWPSYITQTHDSFTQRFNCAIAELASQIFIPKIDRIKIQGIWQNLETLYAEPSTCGLARFHDPLFEDAFALFTLHVRANLVSDSRLKSWQRLRAGTPKERIWQLESDQGLRDLRRTGTSMDMALIR